MGDWFCKLIPKDISKNEVDKSAIKVIQHLIDREIINPILTDNTLGSDLGYPPGKNWFYAVEDITENHLLNALTNGLEVVKERSVFWSSGLEEINCPNCHHNNIENFSSEIFDEWLNNTGKDKLKCPNCQNETSITTYHFEPTWAFGELGFVFWNWPTFNTNFILELEQLIGTKIEIVEGKL